MTTEFVKIGQSGPTADGRSIEAAWLNDAAETYDPATYTALIWPDHYRYQGNAGKVVEVKSEEENGVTSLYARIQPGKGLLDLNASGQKLFSSMELTPNFAGSGKHYLSGLGVTDMPASLGTHELMFSQRKQDAGNVILCGVELDPEDLTPEEEPPGWFKSFFKQFGQVESGRETETEEDKQKSMEKEEFKQLSKSIEGLGEKFGLLAEALSKAEKPAEFQDKSKQVEEPVKQDPEKQQPDNYSELAGKLDSLTATVQAFTTRLEASAGTTLVPETTLPAGEADIL